MSLLLLVFTHLFPSFITSFPFFLKIYYFFTNLYTHMMLELTTPRSRMLYWLS